MKALLNFIECQSAQNVGKFRFNQILDNHFGRRTLIFLPPLYSLLAVFLSYYPSIFIRFNESNKSEGVSTAFQATVQTNPGARDKFKKHIPLRCYVLFNGTSLSSQSLAHLLHEDDTSIPILHNGREFIPSSSSIPFPRNGLVYTYKQLTGSTREH